MLLKWFERTWIDESMPAIVKGELRRVSSLLSREDSDEHTVVPIKVRIWAQPSILNEIATWVKHMNQRIFVMGSVVERWEYVYTLFMAKWAGGASLMTWCNDAVVDLEKWMEGEM